MGRFLFAAIEGDHVDCLDEIARALGKVPAIPPQSFQEWSTAAPYVDEPNSLVAVQSGNWTILCDDTTLTGALFDNLSLGESLAKRLRSRVVSALGEDTACAYGYRIYADNCTRAVLVHEKIEQNSGVPIPGEPEVTLDDYNEESVLEVLQLLGIDIHDGIEFSTKAAVVQYSA
jgi:hypothetical protein